MNQESVRSLKVVNPLQSAVVHSRDVGLAEVGLAEVAWVNKLCEGLDMPYNTDILKSLSLLVIILQVLKYDISKEELEDILSVSKSKPVVAIHNDIDDIINEMTSSMLSLGDNKKITYSYVMGELGGYVMRDRNIMILLIKNMMNVFKLNISINVTHKGRVVSSDLSILLNNCDIMINQLISIIRTIGSQTHNKSMSQRKLSIMKMMHKTMGVYNTALNKLKQSLEIELPEYVSSIDKYLYRLILSINSFDVGKYTLVRGEREEREPILKSLRVNYDGTSCILSAFPPCSRMTSTIVKMKSKHFDMSPSEFYLLTQVGLERMRPSDLKLVGKHTYVSPTNKSFGDVIIRNTMVRLYSNIEILHGDTSVCVETYNSKMLILLTGHAEVTPKLLYKQGVLSNEKYSIAEVKQYGYVLLYQLSLERKLSELADRRRYTDIANGKILREIYPYTTMCCYREACSSYNKKILVDVDESRTYVCNTCNIAEMCTLCSSNSHEGPCNTDEDTQTESMLHRCPSCNIGLEKIDGCNHITCKCRIQFCWVCDTIFEQDPPPNTQPYNVSISMRSHYAGNACNQFDNDE